MGLVDLFYPGNKNRMDRLNNLVYQCSSYQGFVSDQKEEYENLIKRANEQIIKAFGKVQGMKKIEIEIPGDIIILEVSELIVSVFVSVAYNKGIVAAWTSWMLKQGRIGEAALVKLIGYPAWFKLLRHGGTIVILLALDAILAAITGAAQRDKLRECIHDCIVPRREICKIYMTNQILLKTLNSIVDLFEFLQPSEEDAKSMIDKAVARAKKEMETITDEYVEKFLAEKDIREGAWTKEDHILDTLKRSSLLAVEPMEQLPVDYLDGSLVAAEGEENIYLIIGGKRCLIPNMNTYHALFANSDSVHPVLKIFLDSMPVGDPLSESACLMKCGEEIYFYSNSKKYLVRSIGDFNKVGFRHDSILNITRDQADNIDSAGDFIVADW